MVSGALHRRAHPLRGDDRAPEPAAGGRSRPGSGASEPGRRPSPAPDAVGPRRRVAPSDGSGRRRQGTADSDRLVHLPTGAPGASRRRRLQREGRGSRPAPGRASGGRERGPCSRRVERSRGRRRPGPGRIPRALVGPQRDLRERGREAPGSRRRASNGGSSSCPGRRLLRGGSVRPPRAPEAGAPCAHAGAREPSSLSGRRGIR